MEDSLALATAMEGGGLNLMSVWMSDKHMLLRSQLKTCIQIMVVCCIGSLVASVYLITMLYTGVELQIYMASLVCLVWVLAVVTRGWQYAEINKEIREVKFLYSLGFYKLDPYDVVSVYSSMDGTKRRGPIWSDEQVQLSRYFEYLSELSDDYWKLFFTDRASLVLWSDFKEKGLE